MFLNWHRLPVMPIGQPIKISTPSSRDAGDNDVMLAVMQTISSESGVTPPSTANISADAERQLANSPVRLSNIRRPK